MKKVCLKFSLKNYCESLTLSKLCASIFNSHQLNVHACVSSAETDNELLSCVGGYHIYYTPFEIRA